MNYARFYVVFGEAKIEDLSNQAQYQAAKKFEEAKKAAAQAAAEAATAPKQVSCRQRRKHVKFLPFST